MKRLVAFAILLAGAFGLAILGQSRWPIADPAILQAIGDEARGLRARHAVPPPDRWAEIPKELWPPVTCPG
jgi:hypothetical protein